MFRRALVFREGQDMRARSSQLRTAVFHVIEEVLDGGSSQRTSGFAQGGGVGLVVTAKAVA
ncbi:MAG: hypothetical protein GY769_19755 [bacterium]|nr:hypothetical protein [bacterium]